MIVVMALGPIMSAGCQHSAQVSILADGETSSGHQYVLTHGRTGIGRCWQTIGKLDDDLRIAWRGPWRSEGPMRGAVLVEREASEVVPELSVRSEQARVWLVSTATGGVVASADLAAGMIYPKGTAQPAWATVDGGKLVPLADRAEE